jgi:hypothetical protein
MLASITPLGERGRQSTWSVTVVAFLLGATAAAAGAGALLGALGGVALPEDLAWRERLAILSVALIVAVVLDALPSRVPGPRRQVNERWLDRFRGWVYGLGFGAQLGLGVATVVSSAAMYVAFVAAFLSADAALGACVLGCFGVVRGLTPLVAAPVHRPDQLFAMLARLERSRVAWWRAGVALLAGVLVAAAVGSVA